MSLLDGLMANAGGVDFSALAARTGLSPDEVRTGGEALLRKLAGGTTDPQEATAHAEANTGIPANKLMALLPMLAQSFGAHQHPGGPAAGLAEKLGGAGLLGSLGGLFGS